MPAAQVALVNFSGARDMLSGNTRHKLLPSFPNSGASVPPAAQVALVKFSGARDMLSGRPPFSIITNRAERMRRCQNSERDREIRQDTEYPQFQLGLLEGDFRIFENPSIFFVLATAMPTNIPFGPLVNSSEQRFPSSALE